MLRETHEPQVQVHHRGERGVDGILRLIELAGHDGPIAGVLSAMCGEIAAITGADAVSVFVREDEQLVMRGTHGFPPQALGAVALEIGEGITGLCAECMRPVSAANAPAEAAYKRVPGLDDDQLPVYVGVPLIGGGAAIGVLVLQRRSELFAPADVTLATALGAPVTLAIERRRERAVRSARLAGVAHVGGAALGRAAVIPTVTAFEGAPRLEPAGGAEGEGAGAARPAEQRLERAFARLREDLSRAVRRIGDALDPAIGGALDRFALALCDARLRERLVAAADQPAGLRAVAKEYARAPYRLGRAAAGDHAAELEELCALLGDARTLRPGSIWIGDRVHAFVAILAVARGAAALLASDSIAPAALAIARAVRMPAVSDVAGLFGWARPGDLLAVDGDRGAVLVHPAAVDIERLRRAR